MPVVKPSPDMTEKVTRYLAACIDIVGQTNVESGPQSKPGNDSNTFPWPARTLGVVRPGNGDELAACLAAAASIGCPVHPISRGRAWGLSARSPVVDAVVLDLARLDRILDLDLEHGTVRVEAGVTFAQLQTELVRRGAAYHLPPFGGPPDASVLANALDRGEGSGPIGDRFGHLWDLDVALTTGERLRTGFGRFATTTLEPLHARPAGPLLEGLFSQSSFGCVISGRLALAPKCAHVKYAAFEIGSRDKLPAFLDVLRALVRDGVIDVHDAYLWDGAKRIASSDVRTAFDAASIGPEVLDAWRATIVIRANRQLVFDCKNAVALTELIPVSEAIELDDDDAAPELDVSEGSNVASCYWEKPALPRGVLDPVRDRCGFLWLCPVLPFEGASAARLAELSSATAQRFGTFVMTGIEVVSARALHGYVSLAWDRDVAGADDRAMAAHDALLAAYAAEGFHMYRQTSPSIAATAPSSSAWPDVVRRLRAALDPAGVLATGRVAGL